MEDLGITIDGIYLFTYVNNEENKDSFNSYFQCYTDNKLDVYKVDEVNNRITLVKESIDGSILSCAS